MAFSYRRRYCGPVEAVIFDMAGTVMDFGSIAPAGVFIEVFARSGVEISVAEARGPMGAEKRSHIRSLLNDSAIGERWQRAHGRAPGDEDVDRLYAAFIPLQIDSLPRYSALIPGAIDTSRSLRARNIRIGVNSGYSREMLDVCLREAARQGFVPDSAVAASDVPRARPWPAMCLRNAAELSIVDVSACVKVDDTVPGIDEGLSAGMWTIGLTASGNEVGLSLAEWQELPEIEQQARREKATRRLGQAGAHFIVDSIADVGPVIDEIERRLSQGERP